MRSLLGGVPHEINIPEIRNEILILDFVDKIIDFHVWEEGPNTVMASCHLDVKGEASTSLIQTIFSVHGITHSTIQFNHCKA